MKKSLFLIVSAFMLASCGTPQIEVCKYKDGLQAAVSLTFVDGLIDDYTLIAPCLDRSDSKVHSGSSETISVSLRTG